MTTLLLARHGETDWNREQRFQGHADPPLNQTGRAQAVDLAVALAGEPLAAVYSSPLRRALETAEIVAAAHGQEPVTVDALLEVDVGSWQGLTRAEIEERYPDQFARWLDHVDGFGFEDGESYEQLGGARHPGAARSSRPTIPASGSSPSPTAARSGLPSPTSTPSATPRRAREGRRS